MTNFDVVYLADYPEYTEVCAAWDIGFWAVHNLHRAPTFKRCFKAFEEGQKKDSMPITLLVMERETNRPVAMGSLWEKDSHYWADKTPWITSLFVHEDYRGQGLATALMAKLEEDAKRLGVEKIYLTASAAVGLYEKLGYEVADTRDAPETPTGKQTLFFKDLTQ